jgi:hypothetical protein
MNKLFQISSVFSFWKRRVLPPLEKRSSDFRLEGAGDIGTMRFFKVSKQN